MPELKKELGLFEATVYGVGLILGAGIYAILGEATGLTGGSVVFSFLIAAGVAALTGLSYAELSSLFPKEEGDYIYVRKAFESKRLSELTALFRILVGIIAGAAVSLAFAGYLSSFLDLPILAMAIGLVIVCSLVNFWGIDFSAKINVLFTAIEVTGLLIIVWIGAGSWGNVNVFHLPKGFVGLIKSSFLIFFAYIGFESIVNISEETREAEKKIPRAIIISILLTTILYALVAVSSVAVVDWQVLGQSNSPLATVAMEGWGAQAFTLISAIALFSTTNTVLIILISTSRIMYGVSKEKYHSLPEIFSKIHQKTKTPHFSILAVCILTIVFTFLKDVGLVAGLTNLFLLIVFILVNASLLKLRYKLPEKKRGFKAPLNLGKVSVTAVAGLGSCSALAVFYIFQNFL